ncbi:MAG: hypothetical protein R3335_10905 [Anaerolineales bacterium]|nr:hypothetical protein [Anaerolineales bacterium]
MDFPRFFGGPELDRLIMNPGGAFPPATVSPVVGAVTCSGKISLITEHVQESIDPAPVIFGSPSTVKGGPGLPPL